MQFYSNPQSKLAADRGYPVILKRLLARGFCLFSGLANRLADIFTMINDDGVEFLLDFSQQAWRIDAGKIPVYMLVNDFDQG